jgi:membrane protease subunit HflK
MPWNNQSGGGGPWRPSNQGGPWGQGSGGGGGGGSGGGSPPDLEEIFRRSQNKLKDLIPGGGSPVSGKGIVFFGLVAFAIWLATGIYTVRPDEVGINLVFGRYTGTTQPGLNYNWPYPVGQVVKPRVTAVNTMEVGVRGDASARRGGRNPVAEDSLILTGDENIVDIDFNVQWQISPTSPQSFVFNMQDPVGTVRAVAESTMREVIGRRNIQTILTVDRQAIEQEAREKMQQTLNGYNSGVEIRLVQLLKADPPAQVIDAFRDVQAARQDQDRVKNEAETYASRIVPEARGQATQIVQAAEAYLARTVAEAKGDASRFEQIYAEYTKAPEVTRQRMFLETMERLLGGTDKIILDQRGGSGVVPYLPLDQLQRSGAPAPQTRQGGTN